jgi:DNA-binding response OmpR family regulator
LPFERLRLSQGTTNALRAADFSEGPSVNAPVPSAPSILIVDDDIDAADALALLFQMADFDATVARGGRQGFNAADSMAFDAIVTDIRMPGIDGHALARALRMTKSHETRPFLIAYTGLSESSDAAQEYRDTFDLWFVKPEGLRHIVRAVGDLVERRRRLQGAPA